ncbi:hypothetical protein PLESTB_000056300 [Pleodorina starrii]|uniref:Uncharacterized protein n=1 Tax=Pleodorina starrii TaxID=330485 RepID=A0A9W6EX52_9CHLO|nr:hypothetical protein PLESTB_000056300 [Pleodorina starrii]
MAATAFVLLEPDELFFRDVKLSQAYSQTVRITNTLRGPVELTVKPGSSERYTVVPSSLRLRGGEAASVEVRLRVLRFVQRQKAVEQGHRDIFHIKGIHFDQKFHATFWLTPELEQPQAPKAKPGPSTALVPAQARSWMQETGPSPNMSPPASPTRPRKASGKSVSFAEPGSPRPSGRSGSSSSTSSAPSVDVGGPAFRAAAAAGGGGGSRSLESSPPQHVRNSGLRQALAGLQSPRRSAAFNAIEAGAKHIQNDALDRAIVGSGLPPPGTTAEARFGASASRWGVNASIDIGQLTAAVRVKGGDGAVSSSRDCGPPALQLDSLPPRAPSRSLPSSPGMDHGPAAAGPAFVAVSRSAHTESGAACAEPFVLAGGRRLQSVGSPVAIPPMPLGGFGTANGGNSYASSPAKGRAAQERPSVAASYQLPPRQQEELDGKSPGRRLSPSLGDAVVVVAISSPRAAAQGGVFQADGKAAKPTQVSAAGAGLSDPKVLIGELQRPQQPSGKPSSLWQAEQAAEEELQFLEDEKRAVGLHLARGSLDSLGAELNRLQTQSSSPARAKAVSSPSMLRTATGLRSPTTRAGPDGDWQQQERHWSPEARMRPAARGPPGGADAWRETAQLAWPGAEQNGIRSGRSQLWAEAAGGTSPARAPLSQRPCGGAAGGAPPLRDPGSAAPRSQGGRDADLSARRAHQDPAERHCAPQLPSSTHLELQLQLQSLERQQVSMRRTVEQQQELLGDKASLLQALQDQLKSAQAELKAKGSARSEATGSAQAAQEERAALARERDSLLQRLAGAEADLASSREEAAALRRLQLELQSRQPDVARAVEAALVREQALQDERNRKALELLMSKDARIAELEQHADALGQQNEELRARVSELQERVQAAETQVIGLVQQKEALVEMAQRDRQQADSIIADLESRLAAGDFLGVELAAVQDRAALAEARAAEAERLLAAAEDIRRQVPQRRGEHPDAAFTTAEELRVMCAGFQGQNADAIHLLENTHRMQVAELEARVSGLAQELSRSQSHSASTAGAAKGPGAGARPADPKPAADPRSRMDLEAKLDALRSQLAAANRHSRERAWEQVELDRLRMLVSDRDVEVAELASQVEVLKARLVAATAGTGAQGAAAKGAAAPPAASSPSRLGRARSSEAPASPVRGRQKQQPQQAGRGRSRSLERDAACDVDVDSQGAQVVEAMRRQLAKSEAALRAAQERLALMEARAAVAQKTAGKGEQELEAAQRTMVGSALEHQRLQQELDSARGAAARLNSRISDLVQAEQELHTSEVAGLQERLQRLAEHLAATQPEVLHVLLGQEYMAALSQKAPLPTASPEDRARELEATGAASRDGPSGSGFGAPPGRQQGGRSSAAAAALSRERELETAVDTAETAVAVMQDRLLAALKAAADAGEEAARVRREAEWERDRLEAELRTAREEGSLRIRNLEEAVARLSARGGDAAQAMARSLAEGDAATRRECRLRSELALAQQAAQRSNAQAAELRLQLRDCEQALREARVYGGLLLELGGAGPADNGAACGRGSRAGAASAGGHGSLSHQLEERLGQQAMELERRQQVIARLVDVAERAQADAADLQAELNTLKQAMPDPKQHLHLQYAEVQRRLGATEAELRVCRDAKSSCELELLRLQQQLGEKAREVDVASERLAACERDVAAKEDAASRKAVEVRGAMSKEVALLSRRAAEAQRAADDAEARARELDTQLGNLRAELGEARAELESQSAEVRQVRIKSREEKRAAEEAARQARRSAEMAKQEAQERRSQLTIMMETIEVLQAGNSGEREQRIVSLTAQLSALISRESLAEQRAQGLLADAEASSSVAQQLQSEVSELSQQVARLEQQLAAATSNRLVLEGELAAARSDVRTRDAAALRAARELDDREQRVTSLEGEVEALRRALNETQSRHAEQLAREREEAAAATRQARAESSAAAAASSQAVRLERFQASLDELLAFVESRSQQQAPAVTASAAASGAPDEPSTSPPEPAGSAASWLISTMHRLKALVLDSEREYLAASTDARLYRTESRWAWARVHRLQWALEQRTGEWQVAQARVQQLERAMARRSEEAAVHALEQVALQDKQVSALNERLQATTAKLVVATSQAAGADAALAAARAAAAALQRQAVAAGAERKDLQARLAAAEMEAAGSTEALNMGAEAALAQRDLSIRQYFDAQVATLVAKPDVRDKVMTLAREVCALKLSESQLLASLAAAKHRGDASTQLVANLQGALRAAEDAAEQALSQQSGCAADGAGGAGAGSVAGGLGMEVARLSAQLVAQSHEMFRLQEAALRSKQAYERRESDIEELQAQLAAADLLITQARTEGSAALFALREQLSEVHDQDRQLLIREIRELQERLTATRDLASKDVELAEQRIAEITTAAHTEIEKRVAAALTGQVDASRLHQVEARATCAESKAAYLESQVETLQEALTAAEAQVRELEDLRDVTGAAVASLEATLARIERTAVTSSAGSATGAAAFSGRGSGALSGGARRVPVSGSWGSLQVAASSALPSQASSGSVAGAEPVPQGLAGLSREIMRAKMAEAEAVRKMRAAARSEVELRQKLLQREQRISELKDQLAAKGRSVEELKRSGASFAGGSAAKPAFRSRSPSPVRGSVPSAVARPGAAAAPRRLAAADPAAAAADAAADAEYLAEQVAQLRVDVAKRQAEIERLQCALAEANAAAVVRIEAPRPPAAPAKPGGQAGSASVDRLKDQLATANAEIASALSTANSLLIRLHHQGAPVSGLVAGAATARRAGSPARRAASAPGAAPAGGSTDSALAPGTLSGVMQQLASALQAIRAGPRVGPALPAGPTRAGGSPGKDTSSRGESSPTKSSASRRDASGTAGGSPTRSSSSGAGVFEELQRLREEHRVLAQQREDVGFRCSHLEGELQRCKELMQRLQAAAAKDGDVGRRHADQAASRMAGAAQLSRILEGSIAALQALCDRMQAAAAPTPQAAQADQVHQSLDRLVSELATMDTTDLPPGQTRQGDLSNVTSTPTPATSCLSYNPPSDGTLPSQGGGLASSQSVIAQAPSSSSAHGTAACATPSSDPAPPPWLSWESSCTGPSVREGPKAAEPSARAAADSSSCGGDTAPRLDASSDRSGSLQTEQHPSGSSVGSRPSGPQGLPPSASQGGTTSSSQPDAAGPAGVSHAQAVALATAAAKHKARADKWKQRSKELGAQLSLLNASAAAREAAASERQLASTQQLEEELRTWRAEAARLSAELSGAEAARRELDAAHQGSGHEAHALLAGAAEAAARAAALQHQLDSERARAAAELASHQEEAAALKAAVAQEKGERARLLVSLRESHSSTAQSSDSSEGRFRTESLQAHAATAAARATAERAEERAEAWRAEAESLRQRLQQAERGRANLIVSLEGRLAAAERRAAECGARAAERAEALSSQLAEAEARAAPRFVEAKLQEFELLLASVQAHHEAERQSAMSGIRVGRWDALTRIARYREAIRELQADLRAREAEWEEERAELQAAASSAARRSEAVAADLEELRRQTVDLQAAVEEDRQQLTTRHAAHVQDLQRQIEQERRRCAEQAAAKAEAAVAVAVAVSANERSSEEKAAARLVALESDCSRRVAQAESARGELVRELELVQAQFSQYQAQKAAEVASLERRIHAYIDGGGAGILGGLASRHTSAGGHSAAGSSDSGTLTASRRSGGGAAGHHHRSLRRPGAAGSFAARRRGRSSGSAGGAAADSTVAAAAAAAAAALTVGGPLAAAAGQQSMAPSASQVVALARASEALAAAQREAAFERSLRGRAEGQAGLLRGAMARLRAKLKAVSEQLAEVRARAIPAEEHRQLQAELAACREQLKGARAENARRQKALQALQSLAMAQPGSTVQSMDATMGGGPSAALPTAAMRARTNRFATAPAAGPTGPSLRASFSSSGAPAGLGSGTSGGGLGAPIPPPHGYGTFPHEHMEEMNLNVRLAPAGQGQGQGQGHGALGCGGEDDPLQAALEAATANARAATCALEAEREARQGVEAKLREAKAAVERKAALVRDLKRRVEELEALTQKQALAAAEEAGAEARARSLAAALARKDSLVKELRERLEASQASLAAGSAAAEAGGEELEALRRSSGRLRTELAKREAALRAALSDLDKERTHLSGATKQLDLMTRREAAARRQAAAAGGALRRRAGDLLEALRSMSRVLLQAVAAMDVAADRLTAHPHPAAAAATGGPAAAPPGAAAAAAAAAGMSALDISQLTSLSVEDVRHLLGPDAGDLACMLGLQDQQHHAAAAAMGRSAAAAASLEAARRVGELLAALEAAAAEQGPTAPSGAEGTDLSRDVDEGQSEADQLRDQLLAAVAEAADPAAAAAAVLSSRGSRSGVNAVSASIEGHGSKSRGVTRRASGLGRTAGPGTAAAGGAAGNDPWDSRTLLMLVEEVQAEAQRAESELAMALRGAGAL